VLTGSGGLGLLLREEEAGGLDATICASASSTSLMMASSRAWGVATSVSSGMAIAQGREPPAMDEQCRG
jgi:hypothetical protein